MNKTRYNIAVLMGGVHTYFPQHLLSGIREAGKELDVNLYFFLASNTKIIFQNMLGKDIGNVYDYQLNTIYDYSLLSGMDGLIINFGTIGIYLDDEEKDPAVFAARFGDIPKVILTETADIPNSHYLISDNYQGIRMIMDHLIQGHGYRKILFVSGPEHNTDAGERKKGYLDAMAEAGLPCDASMIALGDYFEFVDEQVETLLDAHPDAEAIVFANDEMTLAGYRVCERRGLVVGRDIAITGYDDGELASGMKPPLTTVSQNGNRMGRQALLDLIERIEGRNPVSRHMPVDFIPRESCGCVQMEEAHRRSAESLCRENKDLRKKIAYIGKENLNFQRKTWFLPFFSRDLNNYVEDDEQFYRQIMVNLNRISSGNKFLFLLNMPVQNEYGDAWKVPDKLYLAACYHDNRVVSYAPYARPVIDQGCTMAEYMNNSKGHQYTFFLLFSNEWQYGLLACDIDYRDFAFFHMVSLQLGLMLRYHEVGKYEAAYRREMSQNMERMRKRNHELDLISGFDALTGLSNLRGCMEQIGRLRPDKEPVHACMIYADLDHLKEINDTWGHHEGDYAIETAGKVLKSCLRETDIIGRIGGDEFLAMVVTDSDSFEANLRSRIKQTCKELNEKSGKPYYVELSIGITDFDYTADTNIQTIIARADTRLYENKKFRKKSIRRQRAAS